MNYFDVVVAIILILALIKGFKNGLIIEFASLAALVMGVIGAIKFSSLTEAWLIQYFQSNYIGIISFLVTFVGIVVGVHLLAKIVDKVVKAVALGMVNRILGGLFSLVKIGFIVSILLAVFSSFDRTFNIIPEETRESSILYAPLSEFAPGLFPYLYFNTESTQNKIREATGITI
jgi:membrane protein required for colicin V production